MLAVSVRHADCRESIYKFRAIRIVVPIKFSMHKRCESFALQTQPAQLQKLRPERMF